MVAAGGAAPDLAAVGEWRLAAYGVAVAPWGRPGRPGPRGGGRASWAWRPAATGADRAAGPAPAVPGAAPPRTLLHAAPGAAAGRGRRRRADLARDGARRGRGRGGPGPLAARPPAVRRPAGGRGGGGGGRPDAPGAPGPGRRAAPLRRRARLPRGGDPAAHQRGPGRGARRRRSPWITTPCRGCWPSSTRCSARSTPCRPRSPEAHQAELEAVRNGLVRVAVDFSEAAHALGQAAPATAAAEAAPLRPRQPAEAKLLSVHDAAAERTAARRSPERLAGGARAGPAGRRRLPRLALGHGAQPGAAAHAAGRPGQHHELQQRQRPVPHGRRRRRGRPGRAPALRRAGEGQRATWCGRSPPAPGSSSRSPSPRDGKTP